MNTEMTRPLTLQRKSNPDLQAIIRWAIILIRRVYKSCIEPFDWHPTQRRISYVPDTILLNQRHVNQNRQGHSGRWTNMMRRTREMIPSPLNIHFEYFFRDAALNRMRQHKYENNKISEGESMDERMARVSSMSGAAMRKRISETHAVTFDGKSCVKNWNRSIDNFKHFKKSPRKK